MSKKRKTKKQKMLSEMRLKLQQLEEQQKPSSPEITIPAYSYKSSFVKPAQITPDRDYAYVTSSIRNTCIITSLLLLANAVLFVLVERNIISLKVLGF